MLDAILLTHAVGEGDSEGVKDLDGTNDGSLLLLGGDDGTGEISKDGYWLELGDHDGDVVGMEENEGLSVYVSGIQA